MVEAGEVMMFRRWPFCCKTEPTLRLILLKNVCCCAARTIPIHKTEGLQRTVAAAGHTAEYLAKMPQEAGSPAQPCSSLQLRSPASKDQLYSEILKNITGSHKCITIWTDDYIKQDDQDGY